MARTYTVKDAAKILGYSTNSIYSFLKENRIKGVRVGKGRFRISEEEMGRLLNISKPGQYITPKSNDTHSERVILESPIVDMSTRQNLTDYVSGHSLTDIRVGVPSLHDWILGLSSLILGTSMILFGSSMEEFSMGGSLLSLPIRVAFLAGGAGLLLSDITNKSRHMWHQVFHGILALGFMICAGVMGYTGDFGSAVFYGALGTGIILPILFGFGGVGSFVLTLGLVLLSIPFGFLNALVTHVGTYFVLDPNELRIISLSFSFLAVLLTSLLWFGAMSYRRMYGFMIRLSGTILLILSYLFAGELLWGRAFVLLLLGLAAWFVPVWLTFRFEHFRDRRLVFQSFGGILILFLGSLFILKTVQGSIASYAKNDFADKTQYGRVTLEKAIETAKVSLESVAQNPVTLETITNKPSDATTAVLRGIFEGNRTFDRIILASSSGIVASQYPLTTSPLDTHTIMRFTTQSGRQVLATSTDTIIEKSGSQTVTFEVIIVPVFDKIRSIRGHVIGYVSMDLIGLELMKISGDASTSYFSVVDSGGQYLIHTDPSFIGTTVLSMHPFMEKTFSATGNSFVYENDKRKLVFFDHVKPFGWTLGLTVDASEALRGIETARIVLAALMSASIALLWFITALRKSKIDVPMTGPPT